MIIIIMVEIIRTIVMDPMGHRVLSLYALLVEFNKVFGSSTLVGPMVVHPTLMASRFGRGMVFDIGLIPMARLITLALVSTTE